MPQELTTTEVATLLGCSRRTVQRMARAKKLPSRQVGERVLVFDRDAIEWIATQRSPRARARRRGQDATRKENARHDHDNA